MHKACLLFIALSCSSLFVEAQKSKPIHVLIVDGFSNHDWKQTTTVTKWILEKSGRFTVDLSTVPLDSIKRQAWDPAFKKYDVIIQSSNNLANQALRWPRRAELALEDYVKNGGGLYILHSANNAFPHWNEYEKMIGMGWRPVTSGYALEVDSNKNIIRIPPGEGKNTSHGSRFNAIIQILNRHPLNKDYPDQWKTASTEVYNFPRGAAENLTVLSYAYDSTQTHRMWPVEWVVSYGKGHVYNSSMGHLWRGDMYPLAYRCIGFQTTMIRVTEWLATGKVTYPVPGNFPTKDLISLKSETDLAQINPVKKFRSWAPTPPMGWNSWDCFGPTVTEDEVKANADYMATHLKKYGWEYIIVDIRWYVANDKAHGYNEKDPKFSIDQYGRFTPAVERFPSAANGKGFKPLADYIHQKGLKFGVHMMRGIPVAAVKQALPVLGTDVTAKDIYSERDLCKWLKDMYTIEEKKKGAQEYYNSVFKLYASWGLDFIKIDDLSAPVYHADEIEMIRKAIDACGRKIVLSTSPGETPITNAQHVQQNANMWRTINDVWDKWSDVKEHFDIFRRWNVYRATGAWPDGDMLPLGHIGIRAERGGNRMTLLTKDEQYTLMTLWCIFRSPLMFGGHLPDNDDFTLSLLTNEEVMNMLKGSRNNRELFHDQDKIAWIADDPATGNKFLALFNVSEKEADITIELASLGINSSCTIKDMWTGKKLGVFNNLFPNNIRSHGAGLFRIIQNQK